MAKISACIISYNEESKIEDCLKSLLPVADEIIIVDSLSTDDTINIAKKYTDKVFPQEFLGHIEQFLWKYFVWIIFSQGQNRTSFT